MTFQDTSEFLTAAVSPSGAEPDILDDIGVFLARAADAIEGVQAAFGVLKAAATDSFGEERSRYLYDRSVKTDNLVSETWTAVFRYFDQAFVAPKHIELSGDSFLPDVLEIGERDIASLRKWDAEKIRQAFAKQFGDIRQTAISQLRERVLHSFGELKPDARIEPYVSMHERGHRDGEMRKTYERRSVEKFTDVVLFLIHLATGKSPSEIEVPTFYGFNDGLEKWDRKELFKKQREPFPGATALRFTAHRQCEIDVTPEVRQRFQAQLEEYRKTRGY